MNLDEYIKKFERGDFSFRELKKMAKSPAINTIFRLYSSYGKAKTVGFHSHDSLNWILCYLERELNLAGFEKAASLLKIDINDSFSVFWNRFEQLNGDNLRQKGSNQNWQKIKSTFDRV